MTTACATICDSFCIIILPAHVVARRCLWLIAVGAALAALIALVANEQVGLAAGLRGVAVAGAAAAPLLLLVAVEQVLTQTADGLVIPLMCDGKKVYYIVFPAKNYYYYNK